MRKILHRKMGIYILVTLIGFLILAGSSYYLQTQDSLEHQQENFTIKLDIAKKRLQAHQDEVTANWKRYDAFSQAKLDVIAYFYDQNPGRTDILKRMAKQWSLSELYITSSSGAIQTSSTGEQSFKNPAIIGSLLTTDRPVMQDNIRYYYSPLKNGNYLIAGRKCGDFIQQQDEIASYNYSLHTIRVGTTGHITVVNPETQTIAYSKNESLIGKTLKELSLDEKILTDGYTNWINCEGTSYYMTCQVLNKNSCLLALIPRSEITNTDKNAVVSTLIIYLLAMIPLMIYFSQSYGKTSMKSFKMKTIPN